MSTFPSKAVFHHCCFCSDFLGGLEVGKGCKRIQQFLQLVGKMSVKTHRSWALALCLKAVCPHDLLSLPSEEATSCRVKDGRPDLGDPTDPATCFPRLVIRRQMSFKDARQYRQSPQTWSPELITTMGLFWSSVKDHPADSEWLTSPEWERPSHSYKPGNSLVFL